MLTLEPPVKRGRFIQDKPNEIEINQKVRLRPIKQAPKALIEVGIN